MNEIKKMLEYLGNAKEINVLIDSEPSKKFQKCSLIKKRRLYTLKLDENMYGVYPFSNQLRVIGSPNSEGIKGISGLFKVPKKNKYISGVIIENA